MATWGSSVTGRALAETEKEWAQVVADYARLRGWTRYHPWLSAHSPRGWPDEALCRPPRLVLAELKSEKGKVSPAQQTWLDLLGACPGVEVYVWRPSDWSHVQEILK
jgi:hypothetical protein